ncbi:MAG TPA: putative 7-carboxy-7-deazaguanine synthase QueE [Lachnospiraceae bacterium]|nr:putative 7-carboxy-7-deazaguanine synthase QueE [Lachnospiraceae bacterium]
MQVVEKFVSINGEGLRAGELAVFIRFKGCNLSCSYCDTTWANEKECPYEEMSPLDIFNYIKSTKVRNVTLTGGEPLLQKDIDKLIDLIEEDDYIRIEIETNGAVDIRRFSSDKVTFTMDYKLPQSGMEEKMLLENFSFLKEKDTVKFVASSKEDLDKAYDIIKKYSLIEKCHVYFSPVFGNIEPDEIVDYMISNNMNDIRLQIQMHKVIWDPEKRGV